VRSGNVVWHPSVATRVHRTGARVEGGATVWFTGLPASGKSTLAAAVEERLLAGGRAAYLLDGDNLRHGLNGDLGFTLEDRAENVRRTAHVARLLADAGVVALASLVSPRQADRRLARELHNAMELPFVEVFVDTPCDECERRDPKGLWARARRGEVRDFTGVDSPYEPPSDPDLVVEGAMSPETGVEAVLELIGSATHT
jgi:bifunctional enzyme CysN/CysC